MRRLILAVVCAVALTPLYPATDAYADTKGPKSPTPVVAMLPPVGDFPDAECNYDSSGNIYIGATGHFWECICEKRTFIPDDCAWYDQGPITGAESRKLKSKLRRSTLPKGRVINTKTWRLMPV